MPDAIVIKTLTKHYRPELIAVNDVSFNIPSGQVFALLGPNGAGKTTLIKMICGLVSPTSGDVWLNDFHVSKQHKQAMQQIGVVLEGTRNIYWRLTTWENLMYFGRLKGVSGKILRQRAEKLLRMFDLWERRRDEPNTFSRGMQQKLAIASALIADPSIILLDEPTLGLDVQAARIVREQVTQLAREQGKTIVITSHQLSMIQAISDQVAIVRAGEIIANQPIQDLLNRFGQEKYVITVEGHVDSHMIPKQVGAKIQVENGSSIISGIVDDPLILHDVLERLYTQDKTLISVQREKLNLEDIFVELTNYETNPTRITR